MGGMGSSAPVQVLRGCVVTELTFRVFGTFGGSGVVQGSGFLGHLRSGGLMYSEWGRGGENCSFEVAVRLSFFCNSFFPFCSVSVCE